MGIKNSIRVKKTYKMKFSPAILVAVASAQDKKVPPRHPLQRLNRLVEFTEEIMTQWFSFLPSQQAWIKKFENNAIRMEKISIEETDDVDRYDREDPAVGIKQLTTGFSKWAQRYISQCSGQKNYQHQVIRMDKWNGLLQAHLEAYKAEQNE